LGAQVFGERQRGEIIPKSVIHPSGERRAGEGGRGVDGRLLLVLLLVGW
jgi:hypothetical protein